MENSIKRMEKSEDGCLCRNRLGFRNATTARSFALTRRARAPTPLGELALKTLEKLRRTDVKDGCQIEDRAQGRIPPSLFEVPNEHAMVAA